jgi:hypothetical protein
VESTTCINADDRTSDIIFFFIGINVSRTTADLSTLCSRALVNVDFLLARAFFAADEVEALIAAVGGWTCEVEEGPLKWRRDL